MYNYFVNSPNHHLETTRLVEILACRGKKIMKNIKICWIFMLSPSKHVLQKYKPLIVQMAEDSTIIAIVKINYELLCDAKTLLSLAFIGSGVGVVQVCTRHHTFICDFVVAFKFCETNLQEMYYELDIMFSPKHFSLFLELLEHISGKLCLTWWKEYATFFIGSKLYILHVTNWTIGAVSLVFKEAWAKTITSVNVLLLQ
jgi:hypothetical protein